MLRKIKQYIFPLLLLILAGLLNIPGLGELYRGSSALGTVLKWLGFCALSAAPVITVLVIMRHTAAPPPEEHYWAKHKPDIAKLGNVMIDDMIRAERQFLLYGFTKGLVVLLTLNMQANKFAEEDICRILDPLIVYRASNEWWLAPLRQQKRRQISQRGEIESKILAVIESGCKHVNGKNIPAADRIESNSVINPFVRDEVRAIIRMHAEGQNPQDIIKTLNGSQEKRSVKLPRKLVEENSVMS